MCAQENDPATPPANTRTWPYRYRLRLLAQGSARKGHWASGEEPPGTTCIYTFERRTINIRRTEHPSTLSSPSANPVSVPTTARADPGHSRPASVLCRRRGGTQPVTSLCLTSRPVQQNNLFITGPDGIPHHHPHGHETPTRLVAQLTHQCKAPSPGKGDARARHASTTSGSHGLPTLQEKKSKGERS